MHAGEAVAGLSTPTPPCQKSTATIWSIRHRRWIGTQPPHPAKPPTAC